MPGSEQPTERVPRDVYVMAWLMVVLLLATATVIATGWMTVAHYIAAVTLVVAAWTLYRAVRGALR